MAYDFDKLERIFGKTNGKCHICRSPSSFSNYVKIDARKAWEVEHSVPRAKGGTDYLNILYAVCAPCNRSKGSSSTRSARAKRGYTSAPLPKSKTMSNALTGGAVSELATFLVPPHLRVAAAVFGAVMGATIGPEVEPD